MSSDTYWGELTPVIDKFMASQKNMPQCGKLTQVMVQSSPPKLYTSSNVHAMETSWANVVVKAISCVLPKGHDGYHTAKEFGGFSFK